MNEKHKFSLKPLPYGYGDLEPYISSLAMKTHHTRHLGSYIESLNRAIDASPKHMGLTLTDIFTKAERDPSSIGEDMRYYSAAVYNHNLYFSLLAPTGNDSFRVPEGKLAEGIRRTYGSFERFMTTFRDTAMDLRGSGWVFLCKSNEGTLEIITCKDHSRPSPDRYIPIILLDCWEHAYYLDHPGRKKEFFECYFRIINWKLADMFYNLHLSYQ